MMRLSPVVAACLAAGVTFASAHAQTNGSARLGGRVVSADSTSRPIARVIVKLSGGGLPQSRTVISDANGTFAFDGLPAGRFTVTASKPAYLTTTYGSKAAGRPGTPVSVTSGARIDDLTIRLPRGAVISGRLTDASGRPVPGIQIGLLRDGKPATPALAASTNQLPLTSDFTSDDRGMYRVFGLEPGTYIVAAGGRSMMNLQAGMLSVGEMDVALQELTRLGQRAPGTPAPAAAPAIVAKYGMVPVYYPSALEPSMSTPVVVAAGDERTGIDIVLRPVRAIAVEGVVVNPAGPIGPIQFALAADFQTPLGITATASPLLVKAPGPDGLFRYEGVAPGHYQIVARTSPSGAGQPARGGGSGAVFIPGNAPSTQPSSGPLLWAMADIHAADTDLTGITLSLRPALHLSGSVRFDGTSTAPADPTTTRLQLVTAGTTGAVSVRNGTVIGRAPIPAVALRADGTFDIAGIVPGTYTFNATGQGQTWWLRSVVAGGRDLLDTGVDIGESSSDISDAVVTFTDRRTALAGTLQTPAGTPAADYFVVLFTTERSFWKPQARRLLSTRPASDGAFTLKDIAPGDYYLAALTDLDPSSWQTPAFLDSVVPAALKVTIAEGESRRQDLRIAQ